MEDIWGGGYGRAYTNGPIGIIGIIGLYGNGWIHFDTKVGEKLESVPCDTPQPLWPVGPTSNDFALYDDDDDDDPDPRARYQCSNYDFLDVGSDDHPAEAPPQVPVPWYREGWAEFPEGEHRHRFWLPAHWRPHWDDARWFDGSTTLRLGTVSDPVIIKF